MFRFMNSLEGRLLTKTNRHADLSLTLQVFSFFTLIGRKRVPMPCFRVAYEGKEFQLGGDDRYSPLGTGAEEREKAEERDACLGPCRPRWALDP